MKNARIGVAILTFLLALSSGSGALATTHGRRTDQANLKAAFLFNVLKFIDWPVTSFEDQHSPIVVGVLGSSSVADELERLVIGKSVNARPVVVKRVQTDSELFLCHMVYFGGSNRARAYEFLKEIQHESILTVGEARWFTSVGGMMDFAVRGDRVRFEMNPSAASRSGLHISSKLLSLAQIVKNKQRERQ